MRHSRPTDRQDNGRGRRHLKGARTHSWRIHKKELHASIRKFVATYMATADPDNEGDIEPAERRDLKKGVREKWAILRAAEHFGRDERTIREAVKPSRPSRGRT